MKPVRILLAMSVIAMAAISLGPAHAAQSIPSVVKMPAQIAGGRPVTISIPDKPASSDAAGLKAWSDQVARFTALYPNVTVNGIEYVYDPVTFSALVAG